MMKKRLSHPMKCCSAFYALLMVTAMFTGCAGVSPEMNDRAKQGGVAPLEHRIAFHQYIANLPTTQEKAYVSLRDTRDFAGIHVGIGGPSLASFHAYRAMLKHPDAAVSFLKLYREARMPGKLYALCGLYETDPVAFNLYIGNFLTNHEYRVMVMDGSAKETPVSGIAEKIVNGYWPNRLKTAEPHYRGGIPESEWTEWFGPWQYTTDSP